MIPLAEPVKIDPSVSFEGRSMVAVLHLDAPNFVAEHLITYLALAARFKAAGLPLVLTQYQRAGISKEVQQAFRERDAVVLDQLRTGETTAFIDAVRFVQAHGGERARILEVKRNNIHIPMGAEIVHLLTSSDLDIAVIGRTSAALERQPRSRSYIEGIASGYLSLLGLPPDACNGDRMYSPRALHYLHLVEYVLQHYNDPWLDTGIHAYVTVLEAVWLRLFRRTVPADELERLRALGELKLSGLQLDYPYDEQRALEEDHEPALVAHRHNEMLSLLAWMLHLYADAPLPRPALLWAKDGYTVRS